MDAVAEAQVLEDGAFVPKRGDAMSRYALIAMGALMSMTISEGLGQSAKSKAIPPIDQDAPAKVETATFALG